MRDLKRLLFSALAIFSVFIVASCGGGSSSGGVGSLGAGGPAGANLASSSVYATSEVSPAFTNVVQFSRTANGAASPTAIVKGPTTSNFSGLAVDQAGNLYVGEDSVGSTQILVYPPGANGGMKPTTTIATGLTDPSNDSPLYSLEVDGAGNVYAGSGSIAVGSGSSARLYLGIAVFSPAANGSFAQSKVIAGPATTINLPVQLAIDSANNLYVASYSPAFLNAILIFNSAASGNVSPVSTISGSNTTIDYVAGVALDLAGNVYVLSRRDSPQAPSILEFAAGSVGNVAPIRTISGPATNMMVPKGLRVDSSGNIYVLDFDRGILKFAPNATGNAAPLSDITASSGVFFQNSIALQQ